MNLIKTLPSGIHVTCLIITTSLSTLTAASEQKHECFFVKGLAGIGWYSEGKSQTLDYGGGHFDVYSDNTGTTSATQFGLGIGYNLGLIDSSIQLGLTWYGDTEHKYKGCIDQYGQAALRSHEYSCKVQSHRLMGEINWSKPFADDLSIFVLAGAGVSWNRLNQFETRSLDPNDVSIKPDFHSETKTDFTWELGAGLNWNFEPQWQLSGLYLYTDSGKAKASADNSPFNNKYETSHISSHNLLISVNYFF